ncbi:hypothetical protein UlMin_025428 [Ulmus minor]
MMGFGVPGDGDDDLNGTFDEMESLALDEPSNDPSVSSESPFVDRQGSGSAFNSILEPPSYAEAIFTSFDSTSGNGHRSPILSPKSDPQSRPDYLKIWVSEPQKEQEGGTTYYTYMITTRTNLPDYGGPGSEFVLRRRFKDVVALSDRLSESYRGFFIPVRPDKGVVESQVMQMGQFVEQRRAALEKYLNKLAAHPVIRKSEELRAFVVVEGQCPLARSVEAGSGMRLNEAAAADVSVVAQPAKAGMDLLRMFKELKQSVANDWGRIKPLVVEEDKEFLERKDCWVEFEHQLSNLSQQAESLVNAQQDIGETVGELGLAFVKLTKFETEEAVLESQRVRAADMKNVATAAVKASRLYRELNGQTVKHLEKLHEYLGVSLAANSAFSDRSSALLTVQTLSSELVSLHSRIEKLEAASSKIFGGDRSRLNKIEELKETIRLTEDAKSRAVREYEQIKENNKNELERLEQERQNDFMEMLRGFVLNQTGYAEKMATVWEKLVDETREYSRDIS